MRLKKTREENAMKDNQSDPDQGDGAKKKVQISAVIICSHDKLNFSFNTSMN